jgi:putative transposase
MEFRTPPRLRGFDYTTVYSVFVTMCTKDRVAYFRDSTTALAAKRSILAQREAGLYWLYAYCIMPDHVHLYIKNRGLRHLSRIIAGLKVDTCRRAIGRRLTWQRGYWDEIIRGFQAPAEVVKYVLDNPVRAGLVEDFRDYPFQGLADRFE